MLCVNCQAVLSIPLSLYHQLKLKYWIAKHELYASWAQLKKVAEICYMCHMGANEVMRQSPDLPDECKVNITTSLIIYDQKTNNDICLVMKVEPEGREESANVYMLLLKKSAQPLPDTIEQPGMDHTGSSLSMNFARRCLQKCLQNHSTCGKLSHGRAWYPTRLIEIRANNRESIPTRLAIRLITTENHKPIGPYCSLSHCWGNLELFRLLKDNVAQLHNGIDLTLLPRTFLDAIQVASNLNIRYIWIDTLCIIQDSPDDWRHEASRMFEVYLYAYLNIAATKAANATEGLFATRSQALLTAIVVLEHGPRPGTYQLLYQKYWNHMVDKAVLNQRAWVLQERLLSARTLHFTNDQLVWDCCESAQLETFDDPLDEAGKKLVGPNGPKCNQNLHLMQTRDAENGDKWLEVIHSYSKSILSYQSDKLYALSGLVKQFGQVLGDTYCAGLWRKSMLFHLTWYTQPPVKGKMRPTNNRAPSWSWLAYDGPVNISSAQDLIGYDKMELAEILNVDVTQVQSDNGDVFKGHLELRAALTPLSVDESGRLKLAVPIKPPFKADQTWLRCKYEYDLTASERTGPFFYIPIWCLLTNSKTLEFKDGCQIRGLIVRIKAHHPLTYERCAQGLLVTDLTKPLQGQRNYLEAVMGAESVSAKDDGDAEDGLQYLSSIRIADQRSKLYTITLV